MKRLKNLLKLALSLGLLLFVLSQIDTKELVKVLKSIDPSWLLAAFILFNLSKIVSSIRLNYYFKDADIYLDEWTNLKLYYLGMYYNLFLPGGVGGDGYKIYLLKKHKEGKVTKLLQATLLDRVSGLVALLFLAAVLLLFSRYAANFPILKYLSILTLIVSYPLFLWLHRKLFQPFSTYLAKTTLLGLLVQLLQLASAYAILKALPGYQPTIEYLTLFLISSVVAILPLTIGGVGAREATFLYGLRFIGEDPSTGVAFSFLFFLITLASSAIGILFVNISTHLASKSR